MVGPKSGSLDTYLRTSSSSDNRPSRASRRMQAAVNCLLVEPMSKTVSGVIGTPCSRSAMP